MLVSREESATRRGGVSSCDVAVTTIAGTVMDAGTSASSPRAAIVQRSSQEDGIVPQHDGGQAAADAQNGAIAAAKISAAMAMTALARMTGIARIQDER